MISHRNKFIFIHIPKCGGMSVESALRRFDCEYIYKHGKESESIPHLAKHATALDFKSQIDDIESYFKFTFVRNPWSWAVSNFVFNEGRHAPYLNNLKHSGYKIYKRHFNSYSKEDGDIKNLFEFWLEWWVNGCNPSQNMMFCDEDGRTLVDFIGRLENFEEDFNKVTDHIGIKGASLPHRNKNKKSNIEYKEYYNENSRKMMEEHFKKDIELFNYTFDE